MIAFKVIATVVFVLFSLLAGQATFELGFGMYGIAAAVCVAVAMFHEIWIQPVQDEIAHQKMIESIGVWSYPKYPVNNLQDAKEIVDALERRIEAVTGAYSELKTDTNEVTED